MRGVRKRGEGRTCGVKLCSQSFFLFGTLISCTFTPSPLPSLPAWWSGNAPLMNACAVSISRAEEAVQI